MEELIINYEKAYIGHKDNTTKNSELANSYYHQIIEIFKVLRDNKTLYKLKPLLSHTHDGVKSWAATHYLMVDDDEAKKGFE